MQVANHLRFLFQAARTPLRPVARGDRLKLSLPRQGGDGPAPRRLRPGCAELLGRLPTTPGAVWIDLGGGSGAHLEALGGRIRQLGKVIIVDTAEPLLRQAQERIGRHGWTNVTTVHADATRLPLQLEEADVVTFCYSLTKMPDWYTAVENAFRLLRLGGHVGVVDYYVSRKHPAGGFRRHGAWTRAFWPWWFARDNVFLNPDHIPYLHQLFEPIHVSEDLQWLPAGRVPYYQFVGRK